MTGGSSWTRSPDVAWVEATDYTVVLRLDDPHPSPRSLDTTASAIWASLGDEPRSFATIVQELAEAFGVAPDMIAEDVHGFLEDLRDLGLVLLDDARETA